MRRKTAGAWLLAGALAVSILGGCANTGSSEETGGQTQAGTEQGESKEETGSTPEETVQEETEKPTEPQAQDNEYTVTEETVKLLGRTYFADKTLWMAYSGSGIEFEVTGTKLDLQLYGDTTAMNASSTGDGCVRYAVYVDGECVADEMMTEAVKNLTVFEGDEERTATVRFVKLSETAMSTIGIRRISVEKGEIAPTPEKDVYIEFVGDSITCGYGVDDEDRNHHFSTTTEDVTKTYAYKTAEALDADYSMVSISGYGVISGYSGNGQIQDSQIIPPYYDKIGFSYATTGGHKVSDWEWDFTKREPDAVVINLGTNDSSYCGSDADKQAQFVKGYVDFLKQIREKNPNAVILCTLGLMGDTLFPSIEEAVSQYTEETGDTNIDTMRYDPITADEGYAADWHPTEATHTRAAGVLTDKLSELLDLEKGE